MKPDAASAGKNDGHNPLFFNMLSSLLNPGTALALREAKDDAAPPAPLEVAMKLVLTNLGINRPWLVFLLTALLTAGRVEGS